MFCTGVSVPLDSEYICKRRLDQGESIGSHGLFSGSDLHFFFLPQTTDNLTKVVVVIYNIYGGTFHILRSDITVVFHVSLGSNNSSLGLGGSVFDEIVVTIHFCEVY